MNPFDASESSDIDDEKLKLLLEEQLDSQLFIKSERSKSAVLFVDIEENENDGFIERRLETIKEKHHKNSPTELQYDTSIVIQPDLPRSEQRKPQKRRWKSADQKVVVYVRDFKRDLESIDEMEIVSNEEPEEK